MKQRTENFLIGAALVLGILGFIVLVVFLISKWPKYTALGFAGCLLISIIHDCFTRRRLARMLRSSGEIREGEDGEFIGIYTPHWEVPHITVPAGRTRFLFPLFESWLPRFSGNEEIPASTDPPKRYFIRFRGRPGRRGHFGHKGSADRIVEITRIDELRTLGK